MDEDSTSRNLSKHFDEHLETNKSQVELPQTFNYLQSEYRDGSYQSTSNRQKIRDLTTQPLHLNEPMIAALHTSDDSFVVHIKIEDEDDK